MTGKDKYVENTFHDEDTGESLNVCYDTEGVAWFTFYNQDGQAYRKEILSMETSEGRITDILSRFTGSV